MRSVVYDSVQELVGNIKKMKHSSNNKYPAGFLSYAANVGIKNQEDDLVIIFSKLPCNASGVYTKNIFPGPAVKISRNNISNNRAQALIVISKNANVATGARGCKDAEQIVDTVASQLDINPDLVQIAGTGIIGKRYPMTNIINHLKKTNKKEFSVNFLKAAKGIMTTDKHPKLYSEKIGGGAITGIAKGVGMIEPNMATLLVYFFTDLAIPKEELDNIFKRVMNNTFNCISIDTDTSTSDSAVIFANGIKGEVDLKRFEKSLYDISVKLIKDILRDGEGSSKIMEVNVIGASTGNQAKLVGKSIINSPLVKTAIHGADPNWGRIIMSIGKCMSETSIDEEKIVISICGFEVYPNYSDKLDALMLLMKEDYITIEVNLNLGTKLAKVWGCDLTCDYVKFNSSYTT